ncbi:MAG: helicase [Thiohalocapsa sp. PB-PSB1]|jgi:hypothetical protein|nr:MAG: helicase [Thiohalocapsa sp. PB-PSB1]HCS90491.1 helicase [Chromatiaceae bacterium]
MNRIMQPAEAWGHVFEIAVKRGLLACLMHLKLLTADRPEIQPWSTLRTAKLYKSVQRALDYQDAARCELCDGVVRHLLLLGYGIGWTCMREWLNQAPKRPKQLCSLWCPLSLPGENGQDDPSQAFCAAFGIDMRTNGLTQQGGPARSDFTALFSAAKGRHQQLLVLEISLNAPMSAPDFSDERAHVDELGRYARLLDLRGVFSHVRAEVDGLDLALSPKLANHLTAFSGPDKPFLKLCQGASYACRTARLLPRQPQGQSLHAQVLAVTAAGVESLSADLTLGSDDPRAQFMQKLGDAYRRKLRVPDTDAEDHLLSEIRAAFHRLIRGLPKAFRRQLKEMEQVPDPGEPIAWSFEESLTEFHRPTDRFTIDAALKQVPDDPEVAALLGENARSILAPLLRQRETHGLVTLRDLHGSAVEAGLATARPGKLNLLVLEGNPGIGKTTAVQRYLTNRDRDGFLMLYFSPRTLINRDVTDKFARDQDQRATGILTVTTNGNLIVQAPNAFREFCPDRAPHRRVDAAVVVDGMDQAILPENTSIWFIGPEIEARLKERWHARGPRKRGLDERTEELRDNQPPGVLRTLAGAAAALLEANPGARRLVLTASIQSYRRTSTGSTIKSLSRMFRSAANTRPGLNERRRFAERFPSILVMVDEIAGDGAGALFVKDICRWLSEQFIEPFEQSDTPPFCVSLAIADASLGNHKVLNSYLEAAPEAPQKVMVSPSAGQEPFRLSAARVAGLGVDNQALHVMTNSYPASRLDITYRVKLHRIEPEQDDHGREKTLRARIRSQGEGALLGSARTEILEAVHAGADQIIFFAQDKAFLRELKTAVLDKREGDASGLAADNVSVLDSSVPEKERRRLISAEYRDRQRVFLMTSSGARGVSFPRATQIIAMVPRFDVASNLMELAQLIYRGRGHYRDADSGEYRSGDDSPRRLTLLIDDWLPTELDASDRRAWLRRVSDLLTLVMMLRATILTRITGDAGLRRPLSLVPVGPIASDENTASIGEPLGIFLREAKIHLGGAKNEKIKGLLKHAYDQAMRVFKEYRLEGKADPGLATGFRSWTDVASRQNFVAAVIAPGNALLPGIHEDAVLPQHCHCIGPVWLEDWSALHNREHFRFEGAASTGSTEQQLLGQLWVIANSSAVSLHMQHAARDLFQVLQSSLSQRHVTQKELGRTNIWLALPLDWPLGGDSARLSASMRGPKYAEDWHAGLCRVLGGRGQIFPIVPDYENVPFAASISNAAPALFAQTLQRHYFMASNELNLLNTLLLSNADETERQD